MDVNSIIKQHNTTAKFGKFVKSKCKTNANCEAFYKAFIKAKQYNYAEVIFKHWKQIAIAKTQKIPVEEEE